MIWFRYMFVTSWAKYKVVFFCVGLCLCFRARFMNVYVFLGCITPIKMVYVLLHLGVCKKKVMRKFQQWRTRAPGENNNERQEHLITILNWQKSENFQRLHVFLSPTPFSGQHGWWYSANYIINIVHLTLD